MTVVDTSSASAAVRGAGRSGRGTEQSTAGRRSLGSVNASQRNRKGAF